MANNVLRLPICFVPLWRQTKANEDMEKNIKERKVMTVKVKKPRYDMSGLIDAPTMPKKGKWERVCIEKTMEQ